MTQRPTDDLSTPDGLDLGALHRTLAEESGLDEFLQELAGRAVRVVPGADSCSVTSRRNGVLITAASSDGQALRLDERQYEVGTGPCVDSMDSGTDQHSADLVNETRWDRYPKYAVAEGVRSVLATPLATNGHSLGALNFYARRPDAFDPDSTQVKRLAGQAAGAVAVALRIERALETAGDLRAAMASRSVIDQAIGIVMAQRRCDAESALTVLRKASQRKNVKLRDLCTRLVAVTGGGPPRPGGFSERPGR